MGATVVVPATPSGHDVENTMINFTLNGQAQRIELEADTPLLWLLRDHLQLNGTKFGCGKGLCGACTVHIDGSPMRSCLFTVAMLEGREVTTIEGLSSESDHPLQRAWIELNTPQCGYCQSGQIMSAAALLESNPNPDDAAIDTAMSGNICRCGTYSRIRKSIHRAADIMQQQRQTPVVQQYQPSEEQSS